MLDFRILTALVYDKAHLIHCVKKFKSAARTAYGNIYGFSDSTAHSRSAFKFCFPFGIAFAFGFRFLDNRKTVLFAERSDSLRIRL